MSRYCNNITIIGSFPPPYGGISVHIKKLSEYLLKSNLDFVVYNTISNSSLSPRIKSVNKHKYMWFFKFVLFGKSKIYHLYSPNWIVRLMFGAMSRFYSDIFIISIHGRSVSSALKNSNKS